MAGHMISCYLKENGCNVTGFARTESKVVDTIIGDALCFEQLKKIILDNKYDVVVNCIGVLNQMAESDKTDAILLNSYLPHYLEEITANTNTQIVHMSTDCVFSGKTGGYRENSIKDGETFYDRTKALGEIENNKDITIRCSIVGPDMNYNGIGLLNWFMKQSEAINGYARVYWTGQTTLQLAKTIKYVTEKKISGLYNIVPNDKISKYELLKLFNKYLRRDCLVIRENVDVMCDKSLIQTRRVDDIFEVPTYEKMIEDLAEWINEHSDLYPQYYMGEKS